MKWLGLSWTSIESRRQSKWSTPAPIAAQAALWSWNGSVAASSAASSLPGSTRAADAVSMSFDHVAKI